MKVGARYEQLMKVVELRQEQRRKTRARSMLSSASKVTLDPQSKKEEFKKQLRRKTNTYSSLDTSINNINSSRSLNSEPILQNGTASNRTSTTSVSHSNDNHNNIKNNNNNVLTDQEKHRNKNRTSLHSPSSLKILQKVRRRSTTMQVLQNLEKVLNRAYLLKVQTKFLDNWRKLTMAHLFNADKICGRMFNSWKKLTSQMRAINRLSKPKTTRRKTATGTITTEKQQVSSRNKSIANLDRTTTTSSSSTSRKQSVVQSSNTLTNQALKPKKRNGSLFLAELQQESIPGEEYINNTNPYPNPKYGDYDQREGEEKAIKQNLIVHTSPESNEQSTMLSPYARSKAKSISMSQMQAQSLSESVIQTNSPPTVIIESTTKTTSVSPEQQQLQNGLSYVSHMFDDSDIDSEVNIASDFFNTSEAFESSGLNMMAEDHNERFHKWRALNKFKLCVLCRREGIKRLNRVFGSQTHRYLGKTNNYNNYYNGDINDAVELPENMIVTKYLLLKKWFGYWQYIKARYQYAVDIHNYTTQCRKTILKRRAFLSLLSRRVGIRSYVKNISADKFLEMLGDNYKYLAVRCFDSGRDAAIQAYNDSTASAFENVSVLKKIYRRFLSNLRSNKVFKQEVRMKLTAMNTSEWQRNIASDAIKNWRRGLWIQKRRRKAKRKTKLLCATFLEGTIRRKFTIWKHRVQNRMYLYDRLDEGLLNITGRYLRIFRKQIIKRRKRLQTYQNILEATVIKTKMQTFNNFRKLLVNRRRYTSRWNTLTKYFDQKEIDTKRLFFDRFTEGSIYGAGMYDTARYHHAARLGRQAMKVWRKCLRVRKNEMISMILKVAEETHSKYEYNTYPVDFMQEIAIVAITNHYRIFRFNRYMKRFKHWYFGRERVRNKIAKMTRYRARRMMRFWMSLAWWKSKGQSGKLYRGGCALDKYINRTNWKLAFTNKIVLKSPRSLNVRTSFNRDDDEYDFNDDDFERSLYSPNEKMSLSTMGAGLALGMGSGTSRNGDFFGSGNRANSGTDMDDYWFDNNNSNNNNSSRNASPTTNSSYNNRNQNNISQNRIFSPGSLLSVSPLPRMPPNRTAIMNMINARNQKTLSRLFTVWKCRAHVPVTVRRRRQTLQRAFKRFSRKLVSNRVNEHMNTIATNFAESRAQYRFLMILMENAVGGIS